MRTPRLVTQFTSTLIGLRPTISSCNKFQKKSRKNFSIWKRPAVDWQFGQMQKSNSEKIWDSQGSRVILFHFLPSGIASFIRFVSY
jgi:hypothetical protein